MAASAQSDPHLRSKPSEPAKIEITRVCPAEGLAAVRPPDFIEVEKNIIALGFFTPSSSRILTDKKKTISAYRYLNGERIESVASILPSAYYGLPVTADQDKYFALQKLIRDQRRQVGVVPDPVGFTSAELLRTLGLKKNGK